MNSNLKAIRLVKMGALFNLLGFDLCPKIDSPFFLLLLFLATGKRDQRKNLDLETVYVTEGNKHLQY